jgi:hypothetical protein
MVERLQALPKDCPNCKRVNADSEGGISSGWHPYIHIPDAPAAGCGNCGHVIYLTKDIVSGLRRTVQKQLPKAAAGKARFGKRR